MLQAKLERFKVRGSFTFKHDESLAKKCNAPTDKSGIYLIYQLDNDLETLVYIGSSGQRKKDGSLKTRKSGLGGMKDRVVNGHHPLFGKFNRKHTFPTQMKFQNIPELKIYWWVTFYGEHAEFPTDVEAILIEEYKLEFNRLPAWHKQL